MSKRIQELAKDWGLPSRELITRLDALGLPGKRPQSTLEDHDLERLADALGRGVRPGVTVGEERVVERMVPGEGSHEGGGTIETTVESRVTRNVIRRRVRREIVSDSGSEGTGDVLAGLDPLPSSGSSGGDAGMDALIGSDAPILFVPEVFSSPAAVEPAPEAVTVVAPAIAESRTETASPPVLVAREVGPPSAPPSPVSAETEPAPSVSESAAGPAPAADEVRPPADEVRPPAAEAPVAIVSKPAAEPAPAPVVRVRRIHVAPGLPKPDPSAPRLPDGMRRVQVLGKIELKRPEPIAPRRPAGGGLAARPAPGAAAPGAAAPAATDAARKKGKKVIRRQGPYDPFVVTDRGRGARRPQKRRVAPGKDVRQTEITTPSARKRVVRMAESLTVGDLARAMGLKAGEIIKKLMEMGVMATVNHTLDLDHATLVASEFEYTIESSQVDVERTLEETEAEEETGELLPRDPVVTMMGHVDHGKTSLLDAVRTTTVAAGEAGGITQHIGAYSVPVGARQVCFLDTPGHEAFTAMRARGAKVTDIVVLVVAADDGIMPQTIEAINHARAASVPIIVAANKMDRPDANLERLKKQLSEHGLVAEDWGGDTTICPVSAKSREGLDHLLEMILLQADVLDLRARREGRARGRVIEAKLDRGRGPVATILVQQGTLRDGEAFVVGNWSGRVRALVGSRGEVVSTAGPSTPVEILGLGGVPDAGDSFAVARDESSAREIASQRQTRHRDRELSKSTKVSLEDFHRQTSGNKVKDLQIVLKVDVQGSGEALREAFGRLSNNEVQVSVLHSSVGGVTESDVLLAAASNAIVIGFNVRPEGKVLALAEHEGVDIRLYTIIYDAIGEVRKALEGLLAPTYREKTVGRAEVRQVFGISGAGTIGGSSVTDGKVLRGAPARLLRDHAVVHEGKVGSLRRFKEDVREVTSGYECGIGLVGFNDLKPGDIIEVYELEEVARKLIPSESPRTSAAAF